MNKIFKIIWNKTTQRLEVVSELAKSQGKATASADNRVEVSSSTKRRPSFVLTALALSMLMLSSEAFAVKNYGPVNSWKSEMIWGVGNTATNDVEKSNTTLPIIVGASNEAGLTDATGDSKKNKYPSVNLFGRNNKAQMGLKVTMVGSDNLLTTTNPTATTNSRAIIVGNDISVKNPQQDATFLGSDINANNANLGIGSKLSVTNGGRAVGHNITLRANSVSGGTDNGIYHDSLAMGEDILVTGNAIVYGSNITAGGNYNNVLLGKDLQNSGSIGATSVGRDVNVRGGWAANAVAVGNSLTVGANSAGWSNQNSGENGVVLGVSSRLGGQKGVVIGYNASNTVNIDATNNNYLSGIAIGDSAKAHESNVVAIGTSATATGVGASAIGANTQATANWTIAAGENAKATEVKATALGNGANATKEAATAVGFQAQATGAWTAAVGPDSRATKDFAVAMGNNANATAANAVAVGKLSTAGKDSALALGNGATANTKDGDVALGASSVTAATILLI